MYQTKVYRKQGGAELRVDYGGILSFGVESNSDAIIQAVTQSNGGLRFTSVANNPATAPIVQFGSSGYPIQVKIQGRPNDLSTLEVRGRTTKASALTGMGIDAECEIRPATTATGGYARGAMGVCRIETGKTLAGTFYATGLYGQWRADGTVNGDVFASAIYGVIEDGGVYTAVNHLAALWLDNHLDEVVTSGKKSFIYMSNNGGMKFDNAFYIYGGTAAQGIAALFNFDTCTGTSGFVGDKVSADIAYSHYRKLACVIDGVAGWILLGLDA